MCIWNILIVYIFKYIRIRNHTPTSQGKARWSSIKSIQQSKLEPYDPTLPILQPSNQLTCKGPREDS